MQRRLMTLGGGVAIGLVVGVVIGRVFFAPAALGQRLGWLFALIVALAALGLVGVMVIWPMLQKRDAVRRAAVQRLVAGDLSTRPEAVVDVDIQRLTLSLRRAMWQVQRVTASLHRTTREIGTQTGSILDAARRQGGAVDRSRMAVADMSQSLSLSASRVTQLDAFSKDASLVLTDMTATISQVAQTLSSLDATSLRTSQRVDGLSARANEVLNAGNALVKLAEQMREAVGNAETAVDTLRRRSDETGELARAVNSTSERGEALVGDSLRGLQRIDETVRKASSLVQGLGASSQDIGRVVDVIQEVADQTNLLALNAAIIASQAGDAGKPFGVVASEVRSLSEKTARSTREIALKIKSIRAGNDRAVELVAQARDEAAAGVALGTKAAAALKDIRATAQRALSAVEATQSEAARLENQSQTLITLSSDVMSRVSDVNRLSVDQASEGHEMSKQMTDMSRVAHSAAGSAKRQVEVGQNLSDAVVKLMSATEEIRQAHAVLKRGDAAIADEVAEVRDDAQKVVRFGDGLSRMVEQLTHEAESLDDEVFRFQLPAPKPGGTLTVGMHRAVSIAQTRGFDPLFTFDLQSSEVSSAMCSTLLRFEDGMLAPDLAESWEADGNGRRFRFSLRRNVTFTDGVSLDAGHVKAHFERLLSPSTASPDAALFKDILGAPEFVSGKAQQIEGVQVLDSHTIEFRLTEPRAFFLRLLALPCTSICRREGDRLIGTGPFKMLEMTGDRVSLERNPAYYRPGLPLLSRLDFVLLPGRHAAIDAYRSQRVQLVSYLHAEHFKEAGLDASMSVSVNTPSVWFLGFHSTSAPFDDVRVRRAIRAGLDVRSLLEKFHPGARAARSLTPPSLLEVDRVHEPRADVALSRRLLAEAGHSKVRLTMPYPPDRDTRDEDKVLFGPLIDAGLVQLEHFEVRDGYWEKMREGRISMVRGNWIADVADPDNFLYVP